jgi:uncharacterized membrane protein
MVEALRHAARRSRPSRYRFDNSGTLRVVSPRDAVLPLALSAFDAIARAGGDNIDIVSLLLEGIEAIALEAVYDDDRDGLRAFAEELKEDCENRLVRKRDRDRVERVCTSLRHRTPPSLVLL